MKTSIDKTIYTGFLNQIAVKVNKDIEKNN